MEVYLLYKELNAKKYIRDKFYSHHTVLLKHSDGTFYYTDLDVGSKGGPCQLYFKEYRFLNMPIFYEPQGLTRKTVDEIMQWIEQNQVAGSPYKLLFNDCQNYAWECIKFLNVFDPPHPPAWARLFNAFRSPDVIDQENYMIQYADSPNALSLS